MVPVTTSCIQTHSEHIRRHLSGCEWSARGAQCSQQHVSDERFGEKVKRNDERISLYVYFYLFRLVCCVHSHLNVLKSTLYSGLRLDRQIDR